MNKTTKALDVDTYRLLIKTIREGFRYEGINHKPNDKIATILQLEYNLGLRISDILNLRVRSFIKDGSRYRLDIREKKTGKYRGFTVPNEVYEFVRDYAYRHSIHPEKKLFDIVERTALKHLKIACDYLGLDDIGTHSFRKGFATNIYVNSNYNIS